jgi:hypothetical protein
MGSMREDSIVPMIASALDLRRVDACDEFDDPHAFECTRCASARWAS